MTISRKEGVGIALAVGGALTLGIVLLQRTPPKGLEATPTADVPAEEAERGAEAAAIENPGWPKELAKLEEAESSEDTSDGDDSNDAKLAFRDDDEDDGKKRDDDDKDDEDDDDKDDEEPPSIPPPLVQPAPPPYFVGPAPEGLGPDAIITDPDDG